MICGQKIEIVPHPFDLWADIGLPDATIEVSRKNYNGKLLNQSAGFGFNIRELLLGNGFFVESLQTMAGPAERANQIFRVRVGSFGKDGFRLRRRERRVGCMGGLVFSGRLSDLPTGTHNHLHGSAADVRPVSVAPA
jgi:hypothetical protein